MIFDDPMPPPDNTRKTIAVAVVTAALTTLVTKIVEWGIEEVKARTASRKKEAMQTEKREECERGCNNCGNRAMDMDLQIYCAAVNKPWGRVLFRGKPAECGPESKLWEEDTRASSLRDEVIGDPDGGTPPWGDR